jgi:hypothetical protein
MNVPAYAMVPLDAVDFAKADKTAGYASMDNDVGNRDSWVTYGVPLEGIPVGATLKTLRVRAAEVEAQNDSPLTHLWRLTTGDARTQIGSIVSHNGYVSATWRSSTLSNYVLLDEETYWLEVQIYFGATATNAPKWFKAEIEYEIPD